MELSRFKVTIKTVKKMAFGSITNKEKYFEKKPIPNP
jgi:hypothetical protein